MSPIVYCLRMFSHKSDYEVFKDCGLNKMLSVFVRSLTEAGVSRLTGITAALKEVLPSNWAGGRKKKFGCEPS